MFFWGCTVYIELRSVRKNQIPVHEWVAFSVFRFCFGFWPVLASILILSGIMERIFVSYWVNKLQYFQTKSVINRITKVYFLPNR